MLDTKKKDNAKRGSDQRLNVILDLHAKLALDRMAKHYGVTNKNVLEQLLLEAQRKLIEQINMPRLDAYASMDFAAMRNSNQV